MILHKSALWTRIQRAPALCCLALGLLLVGCGDKSGGTTSATGSSSANYALSVQLGGDGSVTSTPSGISCTPVGGVCHAVYGRGTSVTLVAAPSTDSNFDGWTGGGTSCTSNTTCTLSMTSTQQLTANFSRRRYRLTVTVSGSGTVTSRPSGINCGTDCGANFPTGTSVTLSAAPASGYAFAGWSGTGVNCPGTGDCTVSMAAATDVAATFTPVAASTLLLQVTVSGSGTVMSSPAGISCGSDCSESYPSGTSVTLTATPASGYAFSGWNGGGCSGTAPCTVTMTTARTVAAAFTPTSYTLTVAVTGSGTVTSSPAGINCGATCSANYASGTSVTLTAAPASGYTFSGWSGSGCAGNGTCTVTMSAARSVSATFTASPTYAVAVTVTGSGTVVSSPAGISCGSTCSANYASGTSVTLTATPASGYTFSGWGGDCSGVSTCTLTVSAARNVTATFRAAATSYQMTWDPIADTRVTGYRIYYSTSPLAATTGVRTIDVGNVTSYSFSPTSVGIAAGSPVYFAVTAVGSTPDIESNFSNEVNIVVQ
ncbi:MAG: InlB B-repeat-containing protein [Sulfurifustis sp.]